MAELDRATIIGLLAQLGDESDAVALDAGRELHRRVREAGLDWDALLVPAPGDTPLVEEDEFDEPEATADAAAPEAAPLPADAAEDRRIIERLLARSDLSDELREELGDLRRDLADGALAEMDRRYIRALAARLGV